jgi:DNA-binding protein HU-beta
LTRGCLDYLFFLTLPVKLGKGGDNMLKADIIEKVAKEARLTKKAAKEAVDSTFDNVNLSLKKGEKVVISGFGTFVVRGRKARKGRNPKTGQTIQLPTMNTVGFIASKGIKKLVR